MTTTSIKRSTYISPARYARLRFVNVWRARLNRNRELLSGACGFMLAIVLVAAMAAMVGNLIFA